jgi:glycosyltransferase involved in cell wall biosynthesis
MRILIFHGYLLGGTGSNIYNARLAESLVALGHDVHLLCQERHPERLPFVDAAGDWDTGKLCVRPLRPASPDRPAHCTVYRPDIAGLLPVYVADRYEGIQARTFAQCTDHEVARYIDADVAAVGELAELVHPEAALANHLVMGPVILARGLLATDTPYAVKIHGSALEYTVKPEPERFLGLAREGLESARGILAGSSHTAHSLWKTIDDQTVVQRTRLGPPGVDVHRFAPNTANDGDGRPRTDRAALHTLARRLRRSASASASDSASSSASGDRPPADGAFARDDLAAAAALERLALLPTGAAEPETHGPLVAFVGKLIVSKGVDLLIAAWPLVLEQVPQATLAVVGFGAYRQALQRLIGALAAGDIEQALDIARAGRAAEEGSTQTAHPLRHLQAFLEDLNGEQREPYLAAAIALPERLVLTGRLDHEELADLLPACEALVVPSTFPESFGMVAAEGAACGALPVSAAHSGLAEVSAVLAQAVPEPAARWLSFPVDDHAVHALAERITDWLQADPPLRARTRRELVATVRKHWSWEGVAKGVIAAAHGELDTLTKPT